MFRLTIIYLLVLSACGKGINGGPPVELDPVNGGTPVTGASALTGYQGKLTENTFGQYVGANTSAQLLSLQYYFYEVKICQDITVSGSGYSNQEGCVYLYGEGPATDGDTDVSGYENYTYEKASADTDPLHYLDLTDMASVKEVINKGVAVPPGTYNYGLIQWYRPIKVKAAIDVSHGKTYVTNEDSLFVDATVNLSQGTTDTAGLAVWEMNNGGAFFKFQTPWVYEGQEETVVTLVFNPDSILKAAVEYEIDGTTGELKSSFDDTNAQMTPPLLQITPVVHKKGETVMKETYLLTYDQDGIAWNIRAEFYYIKEDTEKTVYGIDLRTLYTENTTVAYSDPGQITNFSLSDGNFVLKDWMGMEMFGNFKRLTSLDEAGTLTLNCAAAGIFNLCSASSNQSTGGGGTGTLDVAYSLVGISEVNN